MSTLLFKNLNKIYDNNVQAVFDFNLEIKDKEFIVFVGPSGCGKSTTLRMVAGLESITSGELYIDNVMVNNIEPKDRNIAMVFQNYALYPHMTVYENMAFALKLRKVPCPVYEESEEITKLLEENALRIKEAKALRKQALKKKEEKELLDQVSKKYDEIINFDEKINTLILENQKKGIYEDKINELEKRIQLNENEINKYSKCLEKGGYTEEATKALEDGVKQRTEQRAVLMEQLNNYQKTDVPLFKNRKLTRYKIDVQINRAAKILDLEKYLYRKPSALSGGQRQRVALGRAIVRNPKVFLMDEPLSNLDAKLRSQTRTEIINIHKKVNATTIYVTHDQVEAMTMADRIVIMRDGYIQQIGSPKEIYADPANKFVAGFIGNPAMNFLEVSFDGKDIHVGDAKLKISKKDADLLGKLGYKDKNLILGVRPEKVTLADKKADNTVKAKCEFVELLGYDLIVHTSLSGQKLMFKCESEKDMEVGDDISINMDMDSFYFFDASTNKRIK